MIVALNHNKLTHLQNYVNMIVQINLEKFRDKLVKYFLFFKNEAWRVSSQKPRSFCDMCAARREAAWLA